MLSGARLRDDALRTKLPGKQRLSDSVINLVRARMREVLSLEPHIRAPSFREPRCMRQRRRPANPVAQLRPVLLPKFVTWQVFPDAALEPLKRRHEGLGNIATAERAEATVFIRQLAGE